VTTRIGVLVAAGVLVAPTVSASPDPLPVGPPIGGALWSIVVPAILLAIAGGATALLYRHFAGRVR
jgi:hypothetical protein